MTPPVRPHPTSGEHDPRLRCRLPSVDRLHLHARHPEDSATAGALVGFVAWLEQTGAALTTVDRRLAGAVVGLRQRGAEPAKAPTEAARAALNGYRRRLAEAGEQRGRSKAAVMTVQNPRAMSAACPDTLSGLRDRALVLLSFSIAGRRSEVAGLLVSDIVQADEGLVVTIRFGKTGGRTVAVPYGSHPGTCPVRAWRAWLAASGITEGPVLRRIDRHGRVLGGLAGQSVGAVITQAGERAEVVAHLTDHSARAGLATEARRARHDVKTISRQTGHSPNSAVLYGYLRTVGPCGERYRTLIDRFTRERSCLSADAGPKAGRAALKSAESGSDIIHLNVGGVELGDYD